MATDSEMGLCGGGCKCGALIDCLTSALCCSKGTGMRSSFSAAAESSYLFQWVMGVGGGGGSGEVFERFLILKVCVLWSEHLGPPKIIC